LGGILAALLVAAAVSVYLVIHFTSGEISIPQATYKAPLHTQGTTILDARNRPVRFFSVGEQGLKPNRLGTHCFVQPGSQDPNRFSNLQKLGFNTVFLVFTWGSLEPTPPTINPDGTLTHHYSPTYLHALDKAIREYNHYGMGVVLKLAPKWGAIVPQPGKENCAGHGMPSWLELVSASGSVENSACNFISNIKDSPSVPGPSPQADLGDMWGALAAHYKDNPGLIGADMINEPYPGNYPNCPGYDLAGLYRIVGAKIRTGNPQILLMFQEAPTSYDATGHWVLTSPPPFPNVVYVVHLYASGWSTPAPRYVAASINQPAGPALEHVWEHAGPSGWNIPIWIEEFNSLGYHFGNTGQFWDASMNSAMNFVRVHRLSFGVTTYAGPNGIVDGKSDKVIKPIVLKLAEGLGPTPTGKPAKH
jgi:hypothetical protein